MDKGMLAVISGPSGSGKGTIVKGLLSGGDLVLSVSVTTRKKREGEVEGRDYFFKTEEEFGDLLRNNMLLESTVYAGYHYGTPLDYAESQIGLGKTVILELDVPGALQVKEKYPSSVLAFIMPPTLRELERRLRKRRTETPEMIDRRLAIALEEIKHTDAYDYLIINDELSRAVSDFRSIISAERMRPFRHTEIIKNFNNV